MTLQGADLPKLTAEAQVRFQISQCEICGLQSVTGRVFSQITSVFLCQYYSTNAPYSPSSTCCS